MDDIHYLVSTGKIRLLCDLTDLFDLIESVQDDDENKMSLWIIKKTRFIVC